MIPISLNLVKYQLTFAANGLWIENWDQEKVLLSAEETEKFEEQLMGLCDLFFKENF